MKKMISKYFSVDNNDHFASAYMSLCKPKEKLSFGARTSKIKYCNIKYVCEVDGTKYQIEKQNRMEQSS